MSHNLSDMMCLDVYLSNIKPDEYNKIKHLIKPSGARIMPLQSWDVYSENYSEKLNQAKKQSDIEKIKSFAKKYNWENNFNTIFKQHDFEALVLTDLNQKIIWVNEGFTTMTGYSKKFATNKSPAFLQGKLTSTKTKQNIRVNLKINQPFTEVIINYKEDNTPYKCEVTIFPLYSNRTTHFIALEKQITFN